MTTLKELYKFCIEKSEEYPEHRVEIMDNYHNAYAEVEEGGSETHECELAEESIEQLIEEES